MRQPSQKSSYYCSGKNEQKQYELLTRKTASRATSVKMSAQETVDGQAFSTSAFMLSITSKPLTELLFGNALFSLMISLESSSSSDASHPLASKKEKIYVS